MPLHTFVSLLYFYDRRKGIEEVKRSTSKTAIVSTFDSTFGQQYACHQRKVQKD